MIICPTVQYLDFENEDPFAFQVQCGSRYMGWNSGGIGKWGFIVYGRPNGMPLDMTTWRAFRAQANHFIRLPEDARFLGVSLHGDFLFLTTEPAPRSNQHVDHQLL